MTCPVCGTSTSPAALACPACGNPLGSQTLPVGTELQQKYRIERVLGQGGFGITYAALQVHLGARVAIKELFLAGTVRQGQTIRPPVTLDIAGWQQARKDFTEEGRVLARFNHPDIVRVTDFFEQSGTAYLVMEYLEGDTLQRRIEQGGALPPQTVEAIARRVLVSLGLVHGAGLLHRDLKPDNILLERSGRVVLIDFGSARNYAHGQTIHHTRLVTPGYAPLEQYSTAAKFGPYTDIYALGATLHHALTGHAPPPATDRMLGTPLPPLPAGTPAGLRRAIERSLEVKVTDRPQSTDEVLALLVGQTPSAPVPSGPPASAPTPVPRPAPTPPVPAPPARRGSVWPWLVTILLVGGGYAALSGRVVPPSGPSGSAPEGTPPASGADSFSPAATTSAPEVATFPVVTTAQNLNLRASPDKASANLAVIPGGTALQATREQDGWYEVSLGGQTGWVSAKYALKAVDRQAVQAFTEAAAAGGQVTLGEGVYVLDTPLILNVDTELVGAGLDRTWIISHTGDTVITSRGAAVSYQDLSVMWGRQSPGRTILAEGGQVTAQNVRFSGAVRDEEANLYGSGLWLSQNARGSVRDSYLTGNGYGLYLSEGSQVTVVSSGLSDNALAGMIFLDQSGGQVSASAFDRNGVHGVMVMDQANPTISGNKIRDNRQRGITVHGTAAPTLQSNVAEGNGFQGIGVQDDAEPEITDNTLRNNRQSGLAYFGRGGGSARQNVIELNRTGIAVTGSAGPTLEANTIRLNREAGLAYSDQAGGSASANLIEGNNHPGISAWGDARPVLVGNRIQSNKQSGVVLAERAQATLRENTIQGNTLNGVVITDNAVPKLVSNTFTGNGKAGMLYKRGAGGSADANLCSGNGMDQIVLELTGGQPVISGTGCPMIGQVVQPVDAPASAPSADYATGTDPYSDPADITDPYPGVVEDVEAPFESVDDVGVGMGDR